MAPQPDAARGSRAVPAWSLPAGAETPLARRDWPADVTRSWAIDGSTGSGVSVCLVDSGVDADHPRVGGLERAVVFSPDADGNASPQTDVEGDLCGHGTACAGIVRALAPDCRITSARVLGGGLTGSGAALLSGLRWAVAEGFDLVNMSLSTTKQAFAAELRELVDDAYFRGTTIVASAHNLPVESYPWRFASVISVGTHEEDDPYALYYNPTPPVEFFARGVEVDVAWTGGGTVRVTGNSFATPHVTGLAALVLAKHPRLTPFELKTVLYLTATNVGGDR
jgi:subtilisin family serine protease